MVRATVWAGLLAVTAAGTVRAQEQPAAESVAPASGFRRAPPNCPPPVPNCPVYPPGVYPGYPDVPPLPPEGPVAPGGPADTLLSDRLATPFTTPTAGGGYQGRVFNEEFDGDLGGGGFYHRTVRVGTRVEVRVIGTRQQTVVDPRTGQTTVVTVPVTADVRVPVNRTVRLPVAGRYSGVLITDNDSPRPSDRLYSGYSYYDGVGEALNPGLGGFAQNRELIGFEKTVLGGNGSIGLRLPFVQMSGPVGGGNGSVGDLSVLFKYALVFDRETNDVLSLGLVITAPTAPDNLFGEGPPVPHSVLLQPWVGFVRTFGRRAYAQGITSLIVPTDGRDTTLLGNSVAFGYWLYRGDPARLLPALVPTFEVHVRTPLNNRSPDGAIYFPDIVNLTSGLHVRWTRFSLNGAVSVPVTNPRPWNVEAIANVNFRF
jgi:hypothetical protein